MTQRGFAARRAAPIVLLEVLSCGAWSAFDAAPCAAQGYVLQRFAGTSPGNYEQMGEAVGAAGDIDGDGHADLLVGAIHQGTFGRALIYSGRTGQLLRSWTGTGGDAHFGHSLAILGDLDRDGFPEILVGAPKEEPTQTPHQGQARVFSTATGAQLYAYDGVALFDNMGHAVAAIDDTDGDGVRDFVVTRPGADVGALSDAGEINVYSGATGVRRLQVTGTGRFHWLGLAVAAVGDLDGDGVPDLLGGAPNAPASSGNLANAGRAHLISGAHGGILRTFSGSAAWDRFGWSVAGVGDIDGDGTPDLWIGAPQFDNSGTARGAGYAKLFSGATGSEIATWTGRSFGERFGHAVASAGDLDGDGYSELLASAPWATSSGRTEAGEVRLYAGRTQALLAEFSGAGSNDFFGASLAAAGDVDGDGLSDVIVGAPEAYPLPFYGPGYAEVISLVGHPPGTAEFASACPGSGSRVPLLRCYGGAPQVGNAAFGISIQRGLGASRAVLWLAPSAAPLGLPILGCELHLAPPIFDLGQFALAGTAGLPGVGHRFAPAPLPANIELAGVSLFLQSFHLDPGGPQGWIAASAGLRVTIAP